MFGNQWLYSMNLLLSKNVLISVIICSASTLTGFFSKVYGQSGSGALFSPRTDVKLPSLDSLPDLVPSSFPLKSSHLPRGNEDTQWSTNKESPQKDTAIPITTSNTPEDFITESEKTDLTKKLNFIVGQPLIFSTDYAINGHSFEGSINAPMADILSELKHQEDLVPVDRSMWRICRSNPKTYCLSLPTLPSSDDFISDNHPSLLFELKADESIIENKGNVIISFINGGSIARLIIGCGVLIKSYGILLEMEHVYARKCPNDNPNDKRDNSTDKSSRDDTLINDNRNPSKEAIKSRLRKTPEDDEGDDGDGGKKGNTSDNTPTGHAADTFIPNLGDSERTDQKSIAAFRWSKVRNSIRLNKNPVTNDSIKSSSYSLNLLKKKKESNIKKLKGQLSSNEKLQKLFEKNHQDGGKNKQIKKELTSKIKNIKKTNDHLREQIETETNSLNETKKFLDHKNNFEIKKAIEQATKNQNNPDSIVWGTDQKGHDRDENLVPEVKKPNSVDDPAFVKHPNPKSGNDRKDRGCNLHCAEPALNL